MTPSQLSSKHRFRTGCRAQLVRATCANLSVADLHRASMGRERRVVWNTHRLRRARLGDGYEHGYEDVAMPPGGAIGPWSVRELASD